MLFRAVSRTVWLALLLSLGHVVRAEPPARAQGALGVQLRLAVGMTQRHVAVTAADGPRSLQLGPTPAISLRIDSEAPLGVWRLGVGLDYRSSVLGRVHDVAAGPNADATQAAVRSHAFEAGMRARVALGSEPSASSLAVFVGYGVRAFASVAALQMPRFSLHGAVLRVELELALQTTGARLHLAPEFQWLPSISAGMRDVAGIRGGAFAVGGVAVLTLPISARWGLQLAYRESRAWSPQATRSFRDVERYVLLGVTYDWL